MRRHTPIAVLFVLASAITASATDMDSLGLRSNAYTFSALGTPSNGTVRYCSDCTQTNPCAGSGSGATARRENGAWVCGGGGANPTPAPTDTPQPTATPQSTPTPIPADFVIPGAVCQNATAGINWDTPTSNAAVATCATGTNTKLGTLDFGSGDLTAQITLRVPSGWSSGSISATFIWKTSATSGNVVWKLSTACTDVAATATDDPSFNTADTVTSAAPGTANRVQSATISALTMTGCSAGNLWHIKIERNQGVGSDTMGTTAARVISVDISVPRS